MSRRLGRPTVGVVVLTCQLCAGWGTLGRRGGRKRPAIGWQSLTETEKVLRLVVDGMRNRDIAERLLISQPTVETHLTHIFRKLGISSRTELVAMANREGIA